MPSVLEQLAIDGSETADFLVARFLTKPGLGYEESVSTFQPYTEIREVNEDARTAGQQILERAFRKTKKGYLYVNNRMEGHAPGTIAAILARYGAAG